MSPVEARPGIPREIVGAPLTPRELEIVGLIADGLSNSEIAARLWIAHETVKSHVRHILQKLNAHSRAYAAAEAIRRGWIE